MALGEAVYNTFDHRNIGGTGRIRLRADSRKFVIVLTDEDSDRPAYASNYRKYGWAGANTFSDPIEPNSWPSYSASRGQFPQELAATVSALASRDATIYLFARETNGQSRKQYGDPDCDSSDSDFSNFDRAKTLDCLRRAGLGPSLVGSMLSQGKLARVFNVLDITKSGVVDNVFRDAVRSIAKCELRKRDVPLVSPVGSAVPFDAWDEARKRAEGDDLADCVSHQCSPSRGCYVEYLCGSKCDQCRIGGVCYRAFDQHPSGDCRFCIPAKSKTAWSSCSGQPSGESCKKYNCIADFGYCGVENVCTVACNRCSVNGQCLDKDWSNPDNVCEKCRPTENFGSWTDTCPTCSPACANGGVCEGTTARKCNCQGTGFLGAGCDEQPTCTPACANGGSCVIVDYAAGTTACNCESTGFSGDTCEVCKKGDPCEQLEAPEPGAESGPVMECAVPCANGGVCDLRKGECNCDGTGFGGLTCNTRLATDAPTPSPTPKPTGIVDETQSKEAICRARCAESCQGVAVASCACDPISNELTVECAGAVTMAPVTPRCQKECDTACPHGALDCACDESDLNNIKMQVECRAPPPIFFMDAASSLTLHSVAALLATLATVFQLL